jgi:hypothetical protein
MKVSVCDSVQPSSFMRFYPAFHVEAPAEKIETALLGGPDRVRAVLVQDALLELPVVGRVRMGRCDRHGRADRHEQSRNKRAGNPANRRIVTLTRCLPLGITQLR